MDYEQKYKKALELARDYYKANVNLSEKDENSMLEDIFPELAESEDDRIRTFLHHTFTAQYLCKDKLGKWHGEPVVNILSWLEKQGQSTFDKCRQEGDRIVENPDGTHFNISQLERVAKVEPKFRVGDWVVWKENYYRVNYKDFCGYELTDQKGLNTSLEYGTVDENIYLWTLADAKDGDILLSKYNQPFIYNGIFDEECVGAYCGIDKFGNDFLEDTFSCDWSCKEGVKPTTKEQRDILFQKMKEAGYEWDEDKKELRKIEKQAPKSQGKELEDYYITPNKEFFQFIYDRLRYVHKENPNTDYMLSLKARICNMEYLEQSKSAIKASDWYVSKVDGKIDDMSYTLTYTQKNKDEQPKWSKEDEKNWCGIIDEIEANKSTAPDYDIETYDRFLSWLNSIKQRMEE